MATSPNLGITLIESGQSQKEVTMNEAITILDAVIGGGIIDKDLATPPGSPAAGDRYIVAASPTGAWTGHAKDIAYFFNSGWRFITPGEGLFAWVNDEDNLYVYTGSAWSASIGGSINPSMLGINATADATNRLSVNTDAILFNHNGTSVQCKLNKSASGSTASFLFQDAFSGRAEIGLTGDDDFHFKVSDGTTWWDSLTLSHSTGGIGFLGKTPAIQQTGGAATAGSTYTAGTEKVMLQKAYDCLRTFGLLS